MAPLVKFIHLEQGRGGIFDLPFANTSPPVTRIGTSACDTCVCVYIPISSTKCFAAHIDGHAWCAQDHEDAGTLPNPKLTTFERWVPTVEMGKALKQFTKKLLLERVPELSKGDADFDHANAVVICPRRTVVNEKVAMLSTGSYIVEAINEVFHLKGQGTDDVTEWAHGFVADHNSNKLDYLGFVGASEEQLLRFKKLRDVPAMVQTEADKSDLEILWHMVKEEKATDKGFEAIDTRSWERGWSFELCDGAWRVKKEAKTEQV